MTAFLILPSPAKAGAQLRNADWQRTARRNLDLCDWAPAFAGEGPHSDLADFMTAIAPARIAKIEAPLPFPGEGRGPVAEHALAGAAHRNLDRRDWAPAFAGEALHSGLRTS